MPVPTPTPDELAAKQAITEVIHRYCRAMDRMDAELVTARDKTDYSYRVIGDVK